MNRKSAPRGAFAEILSVIKYPFVATVSFDKGSFPSDPDRIPLVANHVHILVFGTDYIADKMCDSLLLDRLKVQFTAPVDIEWGGPKRPSARKLGVRYVDR